MSSEEGEKIVLNLAGGRGNLKGENEKQNTRSGNLLKPEGDEHYSEYLGGGGGADNRKTFCARTATTEVVLRPMFGRTKSKQS